MANVGGFPRRFGKYTLLAHLATGGMADVFLARQRGPGGFNRECVLKRILPHLSQDEGFVQMFLEEARIVARLSHPNIVSTFDLGQVNNDYFLALEYVDGLTLERILDLEKARGEQAMPWPIAVRIIASIAEGLDHAHKARDSAGVPLLLVHRDVSPSNIVVSRDGVAKVLDFGIAKAMAARDQKLKTGVGIIRGKVPYMSPEQVQGLELDARSDVFSLAAILYEITTGQLPFQGENMNQLTLQITSRDPRSPEELNPAFPRDLTDVLFRGLAKPVDARYQTARDFKLALEQFLSDQHVTCTNYDVEGYLRDLLVGQELPELPPQSEILRVEAEADALEAAASAGTPPTAVPTVEKDQLSGPQALRRPSREYGTSPMSAPASNRPSAPATDEPSASHSGMDFLEAEQSEERRRKRSSGGGLLTIVIILIVAATGVIFYVLHVRAVGRVETATPTPPTVTEPAKPVTPTPPVATPPAPTEPAATAPVKPTTPGGAEKAQKPEQKPETATPPAADKEKPANPEAGTAETAVKKDAPKAEKPHRKPAKKTEDGDSAPRELPRLPLPPPADPE